MYLDCLKTMFIFLFQQRFLHFTSVFRRKVKGKGLGGTKQDGGNQGNQE